MTHVGIPAITAPDRNASMIGRIEQAIFDRLGARLENLRGYGKDFAGLWAAIRAQIGGGKYLRPRLFLETVESLRGTQQVSQLLLDDVAVGIEMLHFSFLLHDDVIDRDFRRRQGPNLLGSARDAHPQPDSSEAAQWGSATGILAGDLVIAEVHQIFARLTCDSIQRHRLLDLLDLTIQESVCGEQADAGLGLGAIEPSVRAAMAMTQYKTATYSFALPLQAAAIVTTADPDVESQLAVAARHLGTAYQLQDDLLSAFGDPRLHGKDAWSDFRERKQNPLMAYARTTEMWPTIENYLRHPEHTEANEQALRSLLKACGAEQFVQQALAHELESLHQLLHGSFAIPADTREVLLTHSQTMKGRLK